MFATDQSFEKKNPDTDRDLSKTPGPETFLSLLIYILFYLVLDLSLIEVPAVLLLGVLARGGVRGSGDLVDGRRFPKNFVGKTLRRGKHLEYKYWIRK